MSDLPTPPYAATDDDEPDRSALHPDIAALLDFEPAPRQIPRPDGWTPPRQRRFIALLAHYGSPRQAAEAMQKNLSGLKHLYRTEGADSFRAAWKAAIELAAAHRRSNQAAAAPPPRDVPGTQSRQAWCEPDEGEDDMSDDAKLAMVAELARRFMGKVKAEREARIEGRIVAADFYLRQITALEVGFDLMAQDVGLDGWHALRNCRRAGRSWLEIAETPLSRALDDMRREHWTTQGDPPRPEHPPERYCEPMVSGERGTPGYRLEPSQAGYGALTVPALGYTEEQWAKLDYKEQDAARKRQFAEDAAAQVEWERSARSSLS